MPGLTFLRFGADLVEHVDIVRALERLDQHEHLAAGFAKDVLELVLAVSGVYVDEDRADLGRCVLRGDPFIVVRRPNGDTVALLDPELEERLRGPIHNLVELAVGEPNILMDADDRFRVGIEIGNPIEALADRQPEKRRVRAAAVIASAGLPQGRRLGCNVHNVHRVHCCLCAHRFVIPFLADQMHPFTHSAESFARIRG